MAAPEDANHAGMTASRWEKVNGIFDAALDVPEEEREAWVRQACADAPDIGEEVLSLLENDREARNGFFAAQVEPALASVARAGSAGGHPERVGAYKLVRELGQGGMGTVYLAERADDQYKTEVAIKLVRRGFDTGIILHRFYRERQTLARLQHPNIARLLDGGTTPEGLPYIVMEFVEGQRITDYCRERGLTVPQRLQLFLDVCKAVEYAHRQFVVHRDIKPGNIMVDRGGAVKLLDFGICKLLHAQPDAGETTVASPLTPDYASPEQIRGDPVTAASDVYSLGGVLYELLTGAKPHRLANYSIQAIEQGICEGEITRPSLAAASRPVSRQLEGDLDTILLFAMRKDPEVRYASVEQFAADIRRYLSHEPVLARPDSLAYRARKLLRRRVGAIGAVAAVVLALTVGLALAVRSARIANENLAMVRRLANTFVFDVYDSVRDLPGSTNTRKLIAKTGLEYLDDLSRNASGDIGLQRELAAAYRRIGDVQGYVLGSNLGDTRAALASYEKALALQAPFLRANPADRDAALEEATLHQRIAAMKSYGTDLAPGASAYQKAEEAAAAIHERWPGDERIARHFADVSGEVASRFHRRGDLGPARQRYERARDILLRIEKAHPEDKDARRALADTYSGIGQCDHRQGRLKEALANHQQAVARAEELARSAPDSVTYQRLLMFSHAHVADVSGYPELQNLGDRAASAAAYQKAVAAARRIHEADPADLLAKRDYGAALKRAALVVPDPTERAAAFREAIRVLSETVRDNQDNAMLGEELSYAYHYLGDAYREGGDISAAIQAYHAALEWNDKNIGTGSGSTVAAVAQLCHKLGEVLATRGDREGSLAYARRSLEFALAEDPAAKSRPAPVQRLLTARAYGTMGTVHALLARRKERARDREQAVSWLSKSIEAYREVTRHRPMSDNMRRDLRAVERYLESVR